MEIDRKELKRLAREAMKQASPPFWAVTLVYLLLTTGVTLVSDALIPRPETDLGSLALFATILISLYSVVLDFGYDLWSLWTSRRMEPGLGSLFQGFEVAGRVVLMQILIFVRLLGWCFLLTIPVAGAIAFFPSSFLVLQPLLSALLAVIMLRYALANYLLADRPQDGPTAAIQRSQLLMQGWKWELFKLDFSFIGWELINGLLSTAVLAVLLSRAGFFQTASTLDLNGLLDAFQAVSTGALCSTLSALVTLPLSLWLTPYRGVARAGFYDARLKLQRESAPQMPPV